MLKRNISKQKATNKHKLFNMKGGNGVKLTRNNNNAFNRELLVKVTNAWLGKGEYITESFKLLTTSITYVTHNINENALNDFIIKFTEYDNLPKELEFLHEYVNKQYIEKKIRMNCWQFVLICLLEAGLLTEDDIISLYKYYYNNHNLEQSKRFSDYFELPSKQSITDYFNGNAKTPIRQGDIILFYNDPLSTNPILWHVAICTAVDGDDIYYIGIINNPVTQKKINKHDKYNKISVPFYIKLESLVTHLKSFRKIGKTLAPIKLQIDKSKLKRFLQDTYFKREIDAMIEQKISKISNFREAFTTTFPNTVKNIEDYTNNKLRNAYIHKMHTDINRGDEFLKQHNLLHLVT